LGESIKGGVFNAVRPERVEGPYFFPPAEGEVEGFDELSPNGFPTLGEALG
jgi:hypothetical protein